jgi:hypothetical protein
MSTSVYTDLKLFNFIRKHFMQIYVRKVAVHIWKLLEVMSSYVHSDFPNAMCTSYITVMRHTLDCDKLS